MIFVKRAPVQCIQGSLKVLDKLVCKYIMPHSIENELKTKFVNTVTVSRIIFSY